MNNHLTTCESLAEAISLLAADCLAPDEEIETRQHLAVCTACRERFEQLDSLCSVLHATPPDKRLSVASDAVSRAMLEIQGAPILARGHGTSHSRATSRWQVLAVMAITASVMIVISWQSLSIMTPQSPKVVRRDPPSLIPVPEQESGTAATQVAVGSTQPTWRALQRAAARSEEAFDDLLARDTQAGHFSRLDTHSLLQETEL